MAAGATPHFQNQQGLAVIEIGAKEFMCIGALPPFDHPHVFIDMGGDSEAICPYCSTLYRFNAILGQTESVPPNAHWNDQAA
ncbi:MAG: zinc-finger domain-containing protein [Aestuariivirga sp.]|uniref:zinc-finger domain-containing protein n=1 Tax=Aestuariivirga sp. TaxID=2650926 RepID=UPI0025C507DD|nr:zinc-finger domain-containing protein [Aestuariivirga sp.]MCA3560586.1 zinc-finger domain-containing protein [Aestuariivirga sp.]